MLGLSIGALVSSQDQDDTSDHESAASSHRSALAAYVFLLSWLARLAEDEAKAAAETTDTSAGKICQAIEGQGARGTSRFVNGANLLYPSIGSVARALSAGNLLASQAMQEA